MCTLLQCTRTRTANIQCFQRHDLSGRNTVSLKRSRGSLPLVFGVTLHVTPWPDVTLTATLPTDTPGLLLDTLKLRVLMLAEAHTLSANGPTMLAWPMLQAAG